MTCSLCKLDDAASNALQEKLGVVLPPHPDGLTLSMGVCYAMINSGTWMFWFPKKWVAPVPYLGNPKWEQEHDAWVDSERNLLVNGGRDYGTDI